MLENLPQNRHEIVYRPVDALVPYDRNARQHSVAQVNKIARSIRSYGFNNPILVDAAGVIVAGHGRLRAAKVLGMQTVPVIELGHLSDGQRRAYTLADNRTADDATWDKGMLASELAAIATLTDADFDSIGFSEKEIEKLLADAGGLGASIAPARSARSTPAPAQTTPAASAPIATVLPPEALADGRLNLWCHDNLDALRAMPADSVDSVATDPPYGLGKEPDALEMLRAWIEGGHYEVRSASGFMGREWDAFVPQPAVWKEVFRVLKPGGHIVAFFGTRTYDLGVLAIRLAGFEVRDLMSWLYGTGFPKNLDVAKAIDKSDAMAPRRERALKFTAWMRSTGITVKQINDATGTNMASHYLTEKEQPAVATRDLFELLRPLFCCDVPAEIEALVDERTVESENFKRRAVVGDHRSTSPGSNMRNGLGGEQAENVGVITSAYSEAAQQWEGWGTALKPACEPIVLARKPLVGTVAQNVMQHGVGAINIDACRIHSDDAPGGTYTVKRMAPGADQNKTGDTHQADATFTGLAKPGRWPANVMHDGSAEVIAAFPDKAAARFFFSTKADDDERLASDHPTVKPVNLMQHLVCLVTPPGGVVLDPFAGSGTTGEAAIREGFRAELIEREPQYQADIRQRIANILASESERGRIVAAAAARRLARRKGGQAGAAA